MLNLNEAKQALGLDIAVSPQMQEAIELWANMFTDRPPWRNANTQSLGLSASIAGEVARLVTMEFQSAVTGEGARAQYLKGQYEKFLETLRIHVEYACAGGGLALKPYATGDGIAVDCVPAWRFFPTDFNSLGSVTGAVFVEQCQKGKDTYTRLEYHKVAAEGYTIRNLAFRAQNQNSLGTAVALSAVPEWAELDPLTVIHYAEDGAALERPLFAYFKIPFANTVDPTSPLGVSVYSRADGLIRAADEQYSRILWEYEASELAIDADPTALKSVYDGRPSSLPKRDERLFRKVSVDRRDGGDLYEVFSPAIRDQSLFNGLDKLKKLIEFNCCLSYGTISDPMSVEKTAEEIRSSKQRSHTAISDIQKALQMALEHTVWIMNFYASAFGVPSGAYEVGFTWGDGVLEDVGLEFARRMQLADAGRLRPEKVIAWYFGVTEEVARREYMPEGEEQAPPSGSLPVL